MPRFCVIVFAMYVFFSPHSLASKGPFIEFQVVHEGYEFILDRRERITYTAIFDASVEVPTGSFQTWYHIQTTVERAVYPSTLSFEQANAAVPFSPTVESNLFYQSQQIPGSDQNTYFIYDASNRSLTLEFSIGDFDQDALPKHKYRFSLRDPQGFEATETLPIDPQLYLPTTVGNQSQILAFFQPFGPDSIGINISLFEWPEPVFNTPFYSHATLSIRIIEATDLSGECIADINRDGTIDFFDVAAFIDLYKDGCP